MYTKRILVSVRRGGGGLQAYGAGVDLLVDVAIDGDVTAPPAVQIVEFVVHRRRVEAFLLEVGFLVLESACSNHYHIGIYLCVFNIYIYSYIELKVNLNTK